MPVTILLKAIPILLALSLLSPLHMADAEMRIPVSKFEMVGKIDKVDLGARLISIDGKEFKLTEQTAIYSRHELLQTPMEKLEQLLPDRDVGYITKSADPGMTPIITEILIFE